MKFPITALELAKLAQVSLDRHSQLVQKEMVEELLPRTVMVIISQQDDCLKIANRIAKTWDSVTTKRIVGNLAQALWSHPGSMGGIQIERQLIANGVHPEEANTLATNIVKYSRYSMSAVNLLRHYKSAVSGVHDIIEPIQFRERFLSSPSLPEQLQKEWPVKAKIFANEEFINPGSITEWLGRIEQFIAEVNTASVWARRRLLQEQDPLGWKKITPMSASMAKAYTRRYGRFLMQEFKEINFGGRYLPSSRSRIDSITEELKDLKKKLSSEERAVFKIFEEDYEERSHRISLSNRLSSRSASNRETSPQSFFEAYMTNQSKLGGRDLTVKSSQERISPALIEQMYKLFKTQLELEPKISKFEGTVERDGQTLTVNLDEPVINDASKLKRFLNTLFGN